MPNPSTSPSAPDPAAKTTNAGASTAIGPPPKAPIPPAHPRPQRGDIYWVKMPKQHTVGHEQQKRRPWLIVSNNAISALDMVMGVPLSFQLHKKNRQFRIAILAGDIIHEVGSTNPVDPGERIALTEQTRALSTDRLEKPRSARISDTALFAVEAGIAFVLDIK
jgi:mRNA-degrading endonuclease toxin of MazEF toxin-antitoxin module